MRFRQCLPEISIKLTTKTVLLLLTRSPPKPRLSSLGKVLRKNYFWVLFQIIYRVQKCNFFLYTFLFLVFSSMLSTVVGDIEDTFSKLAKPLDQIRGARYRLRAYQMSVSCWTFTRGNNYQSKEPHRSQSWRYQRSWTRSWLARQRGPSLLYKSYWRPS